MPSNSKLIAELMNNSATISTSAIPNGSGVSIGTIVPFGGTSAPTGFLVCDGSAISRTTYADLFSAISTTWGTGDGSSTFNIPNLQDDFIRGKSGTRAVGATESESTRERAVRIEQAQTSGGYTMPSASLGRVMYFNESGATWGTHPQDYGNHNYTHQKGLGAESFTWHYITQGYGAGTEIRPRNKVALYCIKF